MEPNQDKKAIEVNLGHSQEFFIVELPSNCEADEVRVELEW